MLITIIINHVNFTPFKFMLCAFCRKAILGAVSCLWHENMMPWCSWIIVLSSWNWVSGGARCPTMREVLLVFQYTSLSHSHHCYQSGWMTFNICPSLQHLITIILILALLSMGGCTLMWPLVSFVKQQWQKHRKVAFWGGNKSNVLSWASPLFQICFLLWFP